MEDGSQLTPEQEQTILDERARLLAQKPAPATRAGETIEVVTFSVAGERYALAAPYLREVVRVVEPTPVPGTPNFLAGVVNLRGEIVAVFDPRPLFGLPGSTDARSARLFILGGDRVEFGLLPDAVHEVLALRIDDILPPPDSMAGPGREHLRGVTADALVVLDGARLLQDRRLFIEASESAETSSR